MTTTIDSMTPEKKIKATDAVKALAEKHGGTITPEIVLNDAKRKTSPLHAFFCWDNTAAANEYRRIQASMLIRRIKVTYQASEERTVKVRAFVNVVEPQAEDAPEHIEGHGINARPRGIYVGFESALKVDSYRDQLMRQCKRDVESFRQKYSAISEAAKIIQAMEEFETTLILD
jgi:hypothetical protein